MNDVIFQGGENTKSLNLAKVNLNFSNEDKALDLAYDKVKISRRIYRDGENEYRINGKKVRLRDVRELFLDTGVGKEGYSIISQGRIEQIISSSPKDRRNIFEEASGISKHKFRRDEAIKKLDQVTSDLEIINREWEYKKKDLDLLKTYAENFKKHKKLREELDKASYFYVKSRSDKLLHDEKILVDKIKDLEDSISQKSSTLNDLEESLKPYQKDLTSLDEEITLSKDTLISYEKSIEKSENKLLLNEKEKDYKKKDLERLLQNIKANQARKKDLEKALEISNKKLDDLDESISKIKDKITKNEKSFQEINLTLKNLNDKKSAIDTRLDKLSKEIYQYEVDQKSKEILDEKRAKEEENRQERLKVILGEIKELEDEKNLLNEKIKVQEEKNKSLVNNLKITGQELKVKKEKLDDLIKKNNDNNLRLKTSISEFKLQKENLEKNRGYFYSIQDFLNKTKEEGIDSLYLDSLANLIRVKDGYEEVIDTLMGASLQNIVTKSKKDTRDLINFVNKKRLGRITFLPIDSIRSFRKNKPREDEVIAMAYELIDSSEDLSHIIDHFLGSTVVVKDIDQAISLSQKIKGYRIITMNLDVINNWGSMVAGNDKNRKKNTNLINRNKRLEELKANILRLRNKKDDLNSSYKNLLNDIADLEDKLKSSKETLAREEENYRQNTNKLDGSNIRIENLLARKKDLEEASEEYSLESRTYDIDNLRGEKDKLSKDLEEIMKDLTNLEEELKEKSTQNLKLESKLDITIRDKTLSQNSISDYQNSLIDIENSSRLEEKLRSDIESSLAKLDKEDEKLRKTIDFANKNSSKEKDLIEIKQAKRSKMTSENTSKLEKVKALEDNLKDLDIRKVKLDYDKKSLVEKYEALIYDIKSFTNKSIDDLESDYKDQKHHKVSKTRLTEIQRKLNSVAYFEDDSVSKYKEAKEEFEFLDGQVKDLVNSKTDIEKMIQRLEKDMKEEFTKNFNQINKNFSRIFKTLFLGGDASLILDSDDSLKAGIEIQARPKGKSQKSISLLSGGEKALTAVSLLFAIFETNPAPFAILDEIDAALDETNIKRYIDYLKSLADRTQFIMITHRQTTMQLAERIHGVTIGDDGISKIYSIDFGQN